MLLIVGRRRVVRDLVDLAESLEPRCRALQLEHALFRPRRLDLELGMGRPCGPAKGRDGGNNQPHPRALTRATPFIGVSPWPLRFRKLVRFLVVTLIARGASGPRLIGARRRRSVPADFLPRQCDRRTLRATPGVRSGRAACAQRPKIKQPAPQSFTAMPHGKLPTATDLITLSLSTSITEMSFETPFVV
jgi:hypothetical protein